MKVLKISYYMISVLLITWFLISWLEIGFNNCDPDPVYHSINLFTVIKGCVV